MNRQQIIKNNLYLPVDITHIITKYDYFFNGICTKVSNNKNDFLCNNVNILPNDDIVCFCLGKVLIYDSELRFKQFLDIKSIVHVLTIISDKIFLGCQDGSIRIYDNTYTLLSIFNHHKSPVIDIKFIDDKIVSMARSGPPIVWNLQGDLLLTLGNNSVNQIQVFENKIITDEWLFINVYDSTTGRHEKRYTNAEMCGNLIILKNSNQIYQIVNLPNLIVLEDLKDIIKFYPGDETRIIGQNKGNKITIYNIKNGKKECFGIMGSRNRIWYDNYIINKFIDRNYVFNVETGKNQFIFENNIHEIFIIPFKKGGGFITTHTDGLIKMWK